MKPPEVVLVLNRLLQIVCRSLPMYLAEARPWSRRGREKGLDVLQTVGETHQALTDQITQAVLDRRGRPELGQFPTEFASLHDLGVDYLAATSALHLRRDTPVLQQCIDDLSEAPLTQRLAKRALSETEHSIESLELLAKEKAPEKK